MSRPAAANLQVPRVARLIGHWTFQMLARSRQAGSLAWPAWRLRAKKGKFSALLVRNLLSDARGSPDFDRSTC